jgi:branched-chain amino acid transport system substrate-binding protein
MVRRHVRKVAAPLVAVTLAMGLLATGLNSAAASTKGVPGVTSTTVTIGATVPLSGIASTGYDQVGKAANAVFKWVNAHGGVNGRRIRYILKDDCYDTPGDGCTGVPNTVTQTEALLNVPVFATVGSLGTPTQKSVENLLRSNGVPQLFVNSGSELWNNPVHYPDLFGWQPSYVVESKILGDYIKKRWPGQKVCFIGQNDDFGHDGYMGLNDVGVVPKSPTADDIYYNVADLVSEGGSYFTPFIEKLQSDSCKVVYLDTIPGATAAALGNALGLTYAPHWVISSVGSDPWTVHAELAGTPDSEAGAISFGFLPASTQSSAWHSWMLTVLKAGFPGFTSKTVLNGNMEYGIGWGVAFVEALKAAGRTFTRASFVKILQTTSFATPALVPLKYSASNHQGLEGGLVTEIKSDTQTEVANGTIYTTTSTKTSAVVKATVVNPGIPAWLK